MHAPSPQNEANLDLRQPTNILHMNIRSFPQMANEHMENPGER